MWAPHVRCPVSLTRWQFNKSNGDLDPHELINKFGDTDVYFGSLGTGMTSPAKFMGRKRCILFLCILVENERFQWPQEAKKGGR